jgi:hypothetical protein
MDETRAVLLPGTVGDYERCIQCGEVFIVVGTVLVGGIPPLFDLEGALRDRNSWHK